VTAVPGPSSGVAQRPGVPPDSPWTCPASHPIKGYVASSGRRVYFVPGSRFYEEASPERCYASEGEARRDGGGPAQDVRPRRPSDPLARGPG
jgi:hypothetical protein